MALAGCALGLDTSKLKPKGYVNDFAHVLDAAGAQRIEAYCGAVERGTGAQFAVVTVDTLDDEPIEDVANRLYHEWGIGKKGTDEGVLLLLAIKDHKQRAEVGFGLEPVITDGYAGGVLRGIRPILRQGNYSGALLAAVEQFGSRVAQSKGVAIGNGPVRVSRYRDTGSAPNPLVFIIGFLVVMFILRALFRGGGGGYGGGGGFGGFLTGMLLGNLMGRGRGGWGGGGFGGYDGGGGGGGGWGGGGGGGFGGFGGGDSGGGGASGDW